METYNVTFTIDVHDRSDVDLFINDVHDGTKIDIIGVKVKD